MTDTTEIAARYGVPTPEELAAEYQRRGMTWISDDFYFTYGDDGECCCAVGMLTLIETGDPSVLPELNEQRAMDYLSRLPNCFVSGVISGNDGWAKPSASSDPERKDGWEYGNAVRRWDWS